MNTDELAKLVAKSHLNSVKEFLRRRYPNHNEETRETMRVYGVGLSSEIGSYLQKRYWNALDRCSRRKTLKVGQ